MRSACYHGAATPAEFAHMLGAWETLTVEDADGYIGFCHFQRDDDSAQVYVVFHPGHSSRRVVAAVLAGLRELRHRGVKEVRGYTLPRMLKFLASATALTDDGRGNFVIDLGKLCESQPN